MIVALLADENVHPSITEYPVGTTPTAKQILPRPSHDQVVARITFVGVIRAGAVDLVGTVGPGSATGAGKSTGCSQQEAGQGEESDRAHDSPFVEGHLRLLSKPPTKTVM